MKNLYTFLLCVILMLLNIPGVSTLAQSRPGIECGCTSYGYYKQPATSKFSVYMGENAYEAYSSKKKKYRLVTDYAVPPDLVSLTIYYGGNIIYSQSNTATSWGFSPDEDKFVMHGIDDGKHWFTWLDLDPDPTQEGEAAVLFAPLEPSFVSSATIRFSPHGKYLVYAAISGSTGGLIMNVFDTRTGLQVYDGSSNSLVGLPVKESVEGWGFSPDKKDQTFLHTYLTDGDEYTVIVKNLKSQPGDYVVYETGVQGQSYWAFSPCGDYFAWLHGSTSENPECRFFKTIDNQTVSHIYPGGGIHRFSAHADGHYLIYNFYNDSTRVFDNTSANSCSDVTNPTWNNASLSTGIVEGVKMELIWAGASDASGITAYRIYKVISGNKELLKEVEAVSSCFVTGLSPSAEYTFRVEAGDETGNWSTNGPEEMFSTAIDDPPEWNDKTVNSSDQTETKITISWKAAEDLFGIKSYRVMENGNELCRVGMSELNCRIRNLIAGNTYNFIVEACDEADQWVAGGQLTTSMPAPFNPEWGSEVFLSDSAVTETSFIVKWPVAEDNFNSITAYSVWIDEDSLTLTNYLTRELQINDLEAGTLYKVDIIAYDESGNATNPSLSGNISTLASFSVDTLAYGPGDQKHPDIDGSMVVWWDDSMGAGDIFSYDLATDEITHVTDEPHTQFDPVVSGERIVWTDARNGDWDIYMYDPVLGEVPVCTASGSQDLPAIDGDIIVWRDGRNGNFDIYMYDIKTQTESPVSIRTSAQNWPDISGCYVVYADDRNGNWDIYMFNTYTKKETSICTSSGDQTFPTITHINYRQLAVAFMDDRDEKNIYILYPSFMGGEADLEYLVPLDPPPFISPQAYPHLADKQLVYQDLLGANDGIHWSIYAYQFAYESPSPADVRKEISVSSWASQTNPRTSGGNIVWEYEQEDNTDIYIWKRPPGSDLELSVTELPDPVMVGDTLRYILKLVNKGPRNNFFIETTATIPLMAKYISATADKGAVLTKGKTVKWDIDTLRFGAEAVMEITLFTFEPAVLPFTAETKGKSFELDPSDNKVNETTIVKNVFSRYVGEGGMPAMVVEDNGKTHLAYFQNDTLVYATKNRSDRKWVYRPLGFCASSRNISMVMAPDRSLHILYSDYNWDSYPESRLYHGVLNPLGNWNSRIIAISATGFHSLSADTDSDGELYLAYQEAGGVANPGTFRIRRTVNGAWQEARIVFGDGYDHIDLDADMENNVHLSFYNISQGAGILYQKWDHDLAGQVDKIEPAWKGGQMEGMVTSVRTDSLKQPHISYAGNINDDYRENLKHAWKKDNIWRIGKVDDGSFASSGNQIAIGPEGTINFGYYYLPWNQLRFSSGISGSWIRQIVDDTGEVFGWDLEMAIDRDGYGHIATPGVKYALIPPLLYFNADPDTLDFGAVEPGSSETIMLKMSNPSENEISIDFISIDDPRFSLSRTSFILERFGVDSVELTFTQSSTLGVDKWLRIDYNYPSGLMMEIPVVVKGWQPELSCEPPSINFGAVPKYSSETRKVTLKNSGATDLTFSDINVKLELMPGMVIPTDFSLAGNTCSLLQPGETCEVTIAFSPTKDTPQTSYLNISSNDPVTPLKKVTLSGRSSVPQIYPASGIVDFGYCPEGESVTDTVILINGGTELLNIYSSSILSGEDSDQFIISSSCSSISPGDSCFLTVIMSPVKQGDLNAQLRITSNSQYSNILTVALTGTSYLRTLELSTGLIDFGNVHVGEKSPFLLELTNTGSTDISVGTLHPVSGPDRYEFNHNFDNSVCNILSPGETCTDTVWFIPVFEGAKLAELTISSNDSYHPEQTVILTGLAGTVLPLEATISANPQVGPEPLGVQFHGVITGGQAPYTYYWDFDDMKFSMDPAPVHSFSSFGSYNVSLVVTDISGNSVSETIQIIVAREGVPVVIARAEPGYGEIPLAVQFSAEVSGGDSPLTFLWEFGDGSTATQQNPLHIFSSPGNYKSRITVSDADSDTAKDSLIITAIWNNSLGGDLLDESGVSHINKSSVILYPQTDIMDTTILILDNSHSYLFEGLPMAAYTVRAIPDAGEYPEDLPTYLGNKIALFEATWIQASGHVAGQDILMIKKPEPSGGSGAISGYLITGAGKGLTITGKKDMSGSDPVPDAPVYLRNTSDDKIIAYNMTAADGSFGFDELTNGSYWLIADYQGKPMDNTNTPLTVSDIRNNLEIVAIVGIDRITVQDISTAAEKLNTPRINIYPIPATDKIIIDIPDGIFTGSSVRIKMLDLSGRHVFINDYYELTGIPEMIDIESLNNGMYILEISDNQITYRAKIIKMK